jgi:DNA-binding GntR family transcriptional regulator
MVGKTMRVHVGRHAVCKEIERRILSGESKPGERIKQQVLARELGVAQGAVRESLVELEWLGLIEAIDGLGMFVNELDAARISETYLVREILEGLAARLACSMVGKADIAELRDRAAEIHQVAQNDAMEAAFLDRIFHLRITELSRNTVLIRLSKAYRALGMTVRAFREPAEILEEHLQIVEAIERNLAVDAELLARDHVIRARQMIETSKHWPRMLVPEMQTALLKENQHDSEGNKG